MSVHRQNSDDRQRRCTREEDREVHRHARSTADARLSTRAIPPSSSRQVLAALAAGLIIGGVVSAVGNPTLLSLAAFAEPIGTLWVNAIRMTVVPLVVSLLIVSVASVTSIGSIGRIGRHAALLALGLLVLAAILASVAAPPLLALFPAGSDTLTSTNLTSSNAAGIVAEGVKKLPTFSQWLIELVPVNPVRAAADAAMLPLVIFSLLFAIAASRATADSRAAIVRFFKAVGEAMLILVRWIIALAPIGVFALMLALTARVGASAVGAVGYFIVVIAIVLAVLLIVLYGVAVIAGGYSLREFARAALPAQAVAFSSRSSLASLPALIDSAESHLKIAPATSGFVLPLAVSTFKLGAPVSAVVGALFLARLYGVAFSPLDLVMVAAVSVLLSFSTPGIPSGSLIVVAPLYASLGLPVEGIGILIALDVIPDALKTVTNVTADLVVAAVVSRREAGAT
ncbi:MAG: dicarboxylate/amino acid:cation symporter [Gemmatimonadaceae bacterium]